MTLADEADVLTDTHHRVHIVGVDDGCHIVILGDAREEFVDDERSLWIETRVRLIAEEVFRIHHDGAGDGNTFLHTTRDFARVFLLGINQVDTVEAFLCSLHTFPVIHIREHIEGEHHVLQHIERVEEGCALEDHTHLASHHHLLLLAHLHEVAAVVEYLSAGWFEESDKVLHQHGLSRTTLSDDEVGLSRFKFHTDIIEYGLVAECFCKILNFYHSQSL